MRATNMKVKELAFHRNGISGLGFHVGIVESVEDGEPREMLVIRCGKEIDERVGAVTCFAFDLAKLDQRDIKFLSNSWRGDHFDKVMDDAIAKQTF